MISAYVATLVFGSFYFFVDIPQLHIPTFSAFGLFVIYGILSFLKVKLVILFRLSILTATAAFFNQVFYTGGISSIGIGEFVIPPLLAFFYRPIKDRYYFMALCFICIVAMWVLTFTGYADNLLNDSLQSTHGLMCGLLIFTIVMIYSFLFRNALVVKNKKIGESMKKLQETTHKLIQSEKMASLGMLSAGVAHEINNPLNFINGGIEVLEEGLSNEENLAFESDPCVHVIKEGLDRATVIVKSLNHFSRETDSMNEICDLNVILNNSLVMLQPRLKYKGKVVKELVDEKLLVVGNEGKLHQAFLNIISNAEQAIEKKGTVIVRTTKTGSRINVEISDDGVGISKEHLNKISDPFFTTKPVGQGTGLGLSITYKIIEDHHGRISVDSKPGKGSTFNISFSAL